MVSTQIGIFMLVIAVVLAVSWWLVRSRSERKGAGRVGPISSRHRELLLRFGNVVNDERARERVLAYYQGKYPQDPIECVLEKILCDYHTDNDRVTGGRRFVR